MICETPYPAPQPAEVKSYPQWRREWEAYLLSQHWTDLRQQKFAEAGKACKSCNGKNDIQCHHIRYKNFTDCTTADLIVLCEDCHKVLHAAIKVYKLKIDSVSEEQCADFIAKAKSDPKIYKRLKKCLKKTHRIGDATRPNPTAICDKVKRLVNCHLRNGDSVSGLRSLIAALNHILIEQEIITGAQPVPTGNVALTKSLIDECRTNGSFTNATINALGITRVTMTRGWCQRLVGTKITQEQYKAALAGRGVYRDKLVYGKSA